MSDKSIVTELIERIEKLEKENQELIENITDIGIDKIHLEQQNKDLLFWIFINEGHLRYYSLIDKKIEVMLKEYKKLNNIT